MGKTSKAQQAAEMKKYQEARRREAMEKQKKQNRLMWQIVICVVALILIAVIVPIAISTIQENKRRQEESRIAPKMDELNMKLVEIDQCTETKDVTDHVLLNVSYTDKDGVKQTGDIVIRLFAEVAPKTVANFQNLVKSGFYDGLTFHRVVSGFMIQGGDPEGTGAGSSTPIKGEMTNNGFENNLSHVRGVISMARRGDSYDSGSCQFFIMHQNNPGLDGGYASFGIVVYGMETVDGIAATEVMVDPNYTGTVTEDTEVSTPIYPVTINSATFVKISE